MKSKKSFKVSKNLLIVLSIPILILVFTEIYLRCTCHQKLHRWSNAEKVPDRILGHRYLADTTFILSRPAFANICSTNAYGFSSPNFEKKKKVGTYRIIILGDSDNTGFWSDGSYSYPQRLQNFFKENNFPVEIFDCSTDGANRIKRNIDLIRNECIHYEPDLILLMNQMPIVDILFYYETYKGYLIRTYDISRFEFLKKDIDNFIASKSGWLKLYDISYLFRYYMKVYLDHLNESENKFIIITKKIFDEKTLKDIRLYVRTSIGNNFPYFNVELSDSSPDWNEANVTWNTLPATNRMIKTFYTGIYEQNWIETGLALYLKEKIKDRSQYISLTLSIQASETGEAKHVSFASKKTHELSPALYVTGYKDGQATEFILYPVEDGYVRSGVYSDTNFEALDSIIHVKNKNEHDPDYVKGLLKFDISDLDSIEKAILKLFVKKFDFNNKAIYPNKKYTLSESADTLQNLQLFLEKRNIRFSLYNVYETHSTYSERLAKSFARRGIDYFNLGVTRKEEYSFGVLDRHSSQAGHQAIAEAFFETLTNGIIPEEFLQVSQ